MTIVPVLIAQPLPYRLRPLCPDAEIDRGRFPRGAGVDEFLRGRFVDQTSTMCLPLHLFGGASRHGCDEYG